MVTVAILSADPALRRSLEQLARETPAVTVVGMVERSPELARLMDQKPVDVVLIDSPTHAQLQEWRAARQRPALIVLLAAAGPEAAVDALNAGARAILDRAAGADEILATIMAVKKELVVLAPGLLAELLDGTPDAALAVNGSPRLTRRELEVLAAMADGASNKAIARRLGISFHTAKFHVAAILAKLDAESRTEAVMKAAQSGLVML
jgi:DNA-binding NarL/FixJ family response regulator